jgi:hypothetical protein
VLSGDLTENLTGSFNDFHLISIIGVWPKMVTLPLLVMIKNGRRGSSDDARSLLL